MMDYNKICANCLKQANIVVGLWEGIYERSLNYGDDITNPYDVIPLDSIVLECKSINEICKDIFVPKSLSRNIPIYSFLYATQQIILAFCEIIGEPYDSKYLSFYKKQFWRLEPISGKYAFTLLEMWWVVNEYDHWIKLHGSRENVEKDIKEWYEYHKNGGTINLWHWLMGARE